jgi:hypothetical protein
MTTSPNRRTDPTALSRPTLVAGAGGFIGGHLVHASWLNQVELFFSILERRLLKHGEFASVDDLADCIIAFIRDYNRHAQPFRWTYDGRPLKVA